MVYQLCRFIKVSTFTRIPLLHNKSHLVVVRINSQTNFQLYMVLHPLWVWLYIIKGTFCTRSSPIPILVICLCLMLVSFPESSKSSSLGMITQLLHPALVCLRSSMTYSNTKWLLHFVTSKPGPKVCNVASIWLNSLALTQFNFSNQSSLKNVKG